MGPRLRRKGADRSARIFASVFLLNPDPIAISTLKTGKIVDANPAFARLTGYSPEEYIGSTTVELGLWIDQKDRQAVVDSLGKTGEVSGVEVAAKDRGGQVRNLLFSAKIIGSGRKRYVMTTARDVTERRRSEENLKESEQKFKGLSEQSITGIYLLQDGVIRYANQAFARMLGYAVEEMIGKTAIEDLVLPEDRPLVRENVRKRTSGEVESMHYEFRMTTRDGATKDAEVYSTRTTYGGKTAIIGTCLDITERKRIEAALRESRKRFQDLVETLYDCVWETDSEGRFTYMSPQVKNILGYDQDEVIGKTPYEQMPPEEAKRIAEILEPNARQGRPITAFENRRLRKDGETVVMESNGLPFFDAEGNMKGYRGTDRDITARKHAEEAIERYSDSLMGKIRELNCLHSISEIVKRDDISVEGILQECVLELQKAYLSPDATGCCITWGDRVYCTEGFRRTSSLQERPVMVHGERAGTIEVSFSEEQEGEFGGLYPAGVRPFLDSVANLLGRSVERKQAEEALRESRQRFRDLTETLYDAVWESDDKGRYTYVSPQITGILGYSQDELIGKTAYEQMPPDEAKRASETVEALVRERKPIVAFQSARTRKDGRMVVIEANALPFYDAAGNLKGYRGTDRDITARKEIEEEREKLILELREALSKVKTLSGLLPICASCKKIRNDKGYWEQIEHYIRDHADVDFTHGICPECGQRLYPEYYKKS